MPAVPFIPLIAAGVGAAGSIYAGSQAAGAAQNAANQNNALQQQIWGQIQQNATPFMNQGLATNPLLAGALGFGPDGGAQKAFDAYKTSTGYDSTLKAGVNALASNASTKGLLNSGATIKGAVNYGQQQNQQYFNDWLSRLSQQQGVGLSAANALAGAGQSMVNGVSQNNNNAAGAQGNAWLNGANQVGGFLGAVGSYPWGGGGSSYPQYPGG